MKIEDIIGKNIVVHCDTLEKARSFLNACYAKGLGLWEKDSDSLYNFSPSTCYRIPYDKNKIFWCYLDFYKDDNEVVEFEDLELEENDMNEITDLKEKITAFNATFDGMIKQLEDLEKSVKSAKIEDTKNKDYFSINDVCGELEVLKHDGNIAGYKNERILNNNHFTSKERAEEALNKIKFLLRLERLHDELCPDFAPDYKNDRTTKKYYIYYNHQDKSYTYDYEQCLYDETRVYFSSDIICEKICKILDSENYTENSNE